MSERPIGRGSISLGGVESLVKFPDNRVLLFDSALDAERAKVLFRSNPVVWYSAGIVNIHLGSLTRRKVIFWPNIPAQEIYDHLKEYLDYISGVAEELWIVAPAIPSDWLSVSEIQHEKPADWLRNNLVRYQPRQPESKGVMPNEPSGSSPPTTTHSAISPPPNTPVRGRPVLTVIEGNTVRAIDPDDEPTPTILAEDTLARIFTRTYPNLRYVAAWGRWLEWDNSRWTIDETLKSFNYARAVCVRAAEDSAYAEGVTISSVRKAKSAQTRAAVESLARSDRAHAATVSQWDADTWALCTPGGIVDLKTGQLRAATHQDYATKQTRATPQGACPLWHRFLNDATAGNTELQSYLQRVAGYLLTGDIREEVFFFAYGSGGNGKGTFINTLTHLLGDYAVVAGMETFMEAKHDRHTTELARFRGARMVAAQETEDGRRWNEQRMKQITGGDPITARFMRQDDFTFLPQFKLLLSGNNKPSLRNLDDAMKRRLHLIPFTVKFDGKKRDNTLKDRVLAESDGILAWAVEGCIQWRETGLAPPQTVLAATADYFESQDTIGQWIVDSCTTGPTVRATFTEIYNSYGRWMEENGEYILPQKRFIAKLEERGFTKMKSNGQRFWLGISVPFSGNLTKF